eukprot:scaffold126932_cov45-Phaeocystis_antarctica.AAC.2
MGSSCCSCHSAACSAESQSSPACSLLERRSLEPTEPPSSGGEPDGFRHLCTQRSNGEGVSDSAIRHAERPFVVSRRLLSTSKHPKRAQVCPEIDARTVGLL